MAGTVKLFVYGTLRSDSVGWGSPAQVETPRRAWAKGIMYDYGAFPYVVFCSEADGGTPILGEVQAYDETSHLHRRLHQVELVSGYDYKRIVVTYPDGQREAVMAYAANPWTCANLLPTLSIVSCGDWVEHEAMLKSH